MYTKYSQQTTSAIYQPFAKCLKVNKIRKVPPPGDRTLKKFSPVERTLDMEGTDGQKFYKLERGLSWATIWAMFTYSGRLIAPKS